jgi:hypothetical protein
MTSRLFPCAGCGRHIKSGEIVCPFCTTTVTAPAPLHPTGRTGRPQVSTTLRQSRRRAVTRAALLLGGVLAGATVATACGSSDKGETKPLDGSVGDEGGASPLYGIAYDGGDEDDADAGNVDGSGNFPRKDSGGGAQLYGQPP